MAIWTINRIRDLVTVSRLVKEIGQTTPVPCGSSSTASIKQVIEWVLQPEHVGTGDMVVIEGREYVMLEPAVE